MANANQKNVGKDIRKRREALGLSREGLAYKAGIAHKTVERIEMGENSPRRATLTVIDQALAQVANELKAAA